MRVSKAYVHVDGSAREIEYENVQIHAHAHTPVCQLEHLDAVCPTFTCVSERSLWLWQREQKHTVWDANCKKSKESVC